MELEEALMVHVRMLQQKEFANEYTALQTQLQLPKGSKLWNLHPFLDQRNVLRVGGRIQLGSFPEDKKHPALLPASGVLTSLIVRDYHHKVLHGGTTLTLSTIQEKFWILRGRRTVAAVIKKCVKCFRFNAQGCTQLMGNLPASRLKGYSTFETVGLDFAGPIYVRDRTGRGLRSFKNYIAVFVCFSTHAIHLELVDDMTTNACLGAIRAFIGRRGKPVEIRSDCGTNMIGSAREMADFLAMVQSEKFNNEASTMLATEGIKWEFNPPASPHFGGLWEAAVKAAKYHLRRVTDNTTLTRGQFHVLLAQIEGILNSRPLCPLSTDPSDLQALTPGHFLIGRALNSFPEPCLTSIPEGRLSHWQKVQQLTQHFWRRWNKEVIANYQTRTRWKQEMVKMNIGSMVLLKDENLPPLKWKLGRVTAVHPGQDGLIRVVTIKTESGEYKRPIVKICVFPIEM